LKRLLPGPSLDTNPVLWREWHRTRPSRLAAILLVTFGGFSLAACIWDAGNMYFRGIGPVLGPTAGILCYLLQITFGLLLFSAVAPMSLAEERQRGSLDVLLATPMSTRAIVTGKWLGTFRLVLWIVLAPAILALGLGAADNSAWLAAQGATAREFYGHLSSQQRLWMGALVGLTFLAHGALITSTGLLLACWLKRPSRAIAINVCLFLVIAVGWPILVGTLNRGVVRWSESGLYHVSPLYVAVDAPDRMTMGHRDALEIIEWITMWDRIAVLVALLLYEFTVRTFDRNFERMRLRQTPRTPKPPRTLRAAEPVLVGE
jgi:hypothetical protein